MINWKVRIKNKNFWLAIIPAVLILAQTVAAVFGYTLEIEGVSGQAILGVVTDPTTYGVSDSKRAMTYDTPKKD